MATKTNTKNVRQKYLVQSPYQCPNKKCWHKQGEEVELLPCEAQFLLLSGKITAGKVALATRAATKQKGEG